MITIEQLREWRDAKAAIEITQGAPTFLISQKNGFKTHIFSV